LKLDIKIQWTDFARPLWQVVPCPSIVQRNACLGSTVRACGIFDQTGFALLAQGGEKEMEPSRLGMLDDGASMLRTWP